MHQPPRDGGSWCPVHPRRAHLPGAGAHLLHDATHTSSRRQHDARALRREDSRKPGRLAGSRHTAGWASTRSMRAPERAPRGALAGACTRYPPRCRHAPGRHTLASQQPTERSAAYLLAGGSLFLVTCLTVGPPCRAPARHAPAIHDHQHGDAALQNRITPTATPCRAARRSHSRMAVGWALEAFYDVLKRQLTAARPAHRRHAISAGSGRAPRPLRASHWCSRGPASAGLNGSADPRDSAPRAAHAGARTLRRTGATMLRALPACLQVRALGACLEVRALARASTRCRLRDMTSP